jgi:hypothetical protein
LLPKRKKKRRNTTERIERVCRIQWKGEEYKKGEKERERVGRRKVFPRR